SLDVEEMFYSLETNSILEVVRQAIWNFALPGFVEKARIDDLCLAKVLGIFLKSTCVKVNDTIFRQKSGICIGSAVAPVLSDLFMAHIDRILERSLRDK